MEESRVQAPSDAAEPPTSGDGLAELFDREQVAMVRLAVLMVGSVPLAEDVVQDAFGQVTRRWAELERPGAYLRVCVVNGCRMALRRRATEQRYHDVLASAPEATTADMPARLVELRDALDRLSERQRVVVVLRYFADLPDEQIAELLGCRPATVRSSARRALAALREELE